MFKLTFAAIDNYLLGNGKRHEYDLRLKVSGFMYKVL